MLFVAVPVPFFTAAEWCIIGGDFVFPGRVGDASFWCCKLHHRGVPQCEGGLDSGLAGNHNICCRDGYFGRHPTPRFLLQ